MGTSRRTDLLARSAFLICLMLFSAVAAAQTTESFPEEISIELPGGVPMEFVRVSDGGGAYGIAYFAKHSVTREQWLSLMSSRPWEDLEEPYAATGAVNLTLGQCIEFQELLETYLEEAQQWSVEVQRPPNELVDVICEEGELDRVEELYDKTMDWSEEIPTYMEYVAPFTYVWIARIHARDGCSFAGQKTWHVAAPTESLAYQLATTSYQAANVGLRIFLVPLQEYPGPVTVSAYRNYEFTDNREGWQPFNLPPFSAPTFHSTTGSPGTLEMTSKTNDSEAGCWQSLAILPRQSDLIAPTYAVAVTYRILTDETDPTRVPEVRVRVGADNSQQGDLLSVMSYADAAYSPTPEGREYTLFLKMPSTSPIFRAQFDLLNFDPSDSPWATVKLDRAVIRPMTGIAYDQVRLERSYDFSGGTDGWEYYALPDSFEEPLSSYDEAEDRLALTVAETPGFQFGFWSSTTDTANNVYIEENRLYYGVFTIGSDIEDPDQVPTFRLRFNEDHFRACHITVIASTGTAENSPTSEGSRQYTVFLSPGIGVGGYLLSSFDILADPSFENLAVGGSVYLERLDIYSVPYPAP
ncbi:hypothetical protein KQI84_19250 [bacterium]|nr:hypothetical protein [bacterium]